MAKSAVTSYSSLLKEIANGLTDEDVADIKMMLRYPAATKISTGTQLLFEMERHDDLDEDNLVTLKDVLRQQNLKRLVKIVEKFEKGDQLAKSWPSAALKGKQQQPLDDRPSQFATSAGIQDQLQHHTVHEQNLQGAAPPASYQGNLPQAYQHQPQLTPGDGYRMQQMNPSMYQQSQQSQHQQSSPYQENISSTMGYPNQQQFQVQQQQFPVQQQFSVHQQQQQFPVQQQQQHQQQMMWSQQQHNQTPSSQYNYPMNPTPAQYPVAPFPPGYQSYTGSLHQQSPGGEQHNIQRVKSVPTSRAPPQSSGHAKVVPSKSCPAPHELPQVSEEEAGLKPVQSIALTTKEMNIPAKNTDAVAKTTGVKTINGNILMGTSSMVGGSSSGGLASHVLGGNSISMNGSDQGAVPLQAARVRVNSEEKNNESMGEGVQPMSQQMTDTEADLLLLSGFSGKKLYDFRKVDSITNQSYLVRIPQGVHYITTEGAFAIVPFNSSYTIQLRNNDRRLRCSALVENNGNFAGDWTIDPMGSIDLERPATDDKKFHFMEASRAPSGLGVRIDDPQNGVICVTFTPEKAGALNDLSRGFGHLDITSNGDYFETGSMNDVQRSIAPQPDNKWQVGCTVLQGDSHQRFTRSEDFQLDDSRKTSIVLKLVGKST